MAKLELPVLPVHLYRYRALSRGAEGLRQEIDAIKNAYIYCSAYNRMNDPMEGFYRTSSKMVGTDRYKEVLDLIYTRKIRMGMASFTENNANELMWAHYAANYTGICVGYLTKRLMHGLPNNVSLIRLAYGNEPPRISRSDTEDIDRAARKIFAHKKDSWAYEREWRIITPIADQPVSYNRQNCISRIYLGARMSDENRRQILDELGDCDFTFYEMQVDGYSHEFSKIEAEADDNDEDDEEDRLT